MLVRGRVSKLDIFMPYSKMLVNSSFGVDLIASKIANEGTFRRLDSLLDECYQMTLKTNQDERVSIYRSVPYSKAEGVSFEHSSDGCLLMFRLSAKSYQARGSNYNQWPLLFDCNGEAVSLDHGAPDARLPLISAGSNVEVAFEVGASVLPLTSSFLLCGLSLTLKAVVVRDQIKYYNPLIPSSIVSPTKSRI